MKRDELAALNSATDRSDTQASTDQLSREITPCCRFAKLKRRVPVCDRLFAAPFS
jgi:hypothetical protein